MCGIVGWIDWRRDLRVDRAVIEAMTSTMIPRGPDDGGIWLTSQVALGHRRLAVIDVAGGAQPMSVRVSDTPDAAEIALVFSGEIYNFRALRRELAARRHRFRTESDTEVLLHSYLEWGRECVERLDGMFAFAVHDGRSDDVFLARDRLGIKPLYYHPYPGGLIFASEPKGVLANPLFRAELQADGINELFAMPAAPTPGHGILRDLFELKPGHTLLVARGGNRLTQYWRLETEPHIDSAPGTVAHVRELLEEVIRDQVVSDVPLSALVSGGIDSSAVAALAARRRRDEMGKVALRTFSMDFEGEAEEFEPNSWRTTRDGQYAQIVADHLETRHTSLVLTHDEVWQARGRALRARDFPSWGDLDTCLYLLFETVRSKSVVALSGESADEVFGGYPWHRDHDALRSDTFPWLARSASPSVLLRDDVQQKLRPERYRAERYAEAINEVPYGAWEDSDERIARRGMYLGLTRWLPALLDRKDRLSMALGLEVRVPFCDHRLVEYVWSTPWSLKTQYGSKGLLRRSVAQLLPGEVVERPKSAPPICHHPTYVARLTAELRATLDSACNAFVELVDVAKVKRLLDDGERLPAPTPGPGTNIGLAYLLDLHAWLDDYQVALV